MNQKQQKFLEKLQIEAHLQARLNTNRVLPTQLDGLSSFVGRYPWQVLLVLSGILSFGIEALTRL